MRGNGTWLWTLLLATALAGCDRKPVAASSAEKADPSSRPVIVASIYPLASLLRQMTGEWADVQLMMPPGASPHDFEPAADQMAPLSRADLLVVVGLNLDEWAERAAKRVGPADLPIERMSDLVGKIDARPGNPNQHLWMDPVYAIRFIEALAPVLRKKYPAHADEIARHEKALAEELQQMDEQFRRDLASVPEKKLISYHNAYDLLAERYGLQVVAHLTEIELAPGGEVTPSDLVETIEAVKRYHLKVIYSEPQFPGRAVEMIHEQTGVKILPLDDLGDPARPGYETYQAMLRSDVKTLIEGQSLRSEHG